MGISSTTAKSSFKNYNSEAFSLFPSNLIYLYEIDVSNLLIDKGLQLENNIQIFRFHNHIRLGNNSLFFNGNEYIATPIMAEGFEITSKGVLPTPTLSITVTDESVPLLAILKDAINKLGDLVGSKVTRIKTFAKFIDAQNFENSQAPRDFAPDPSNFSKDVFYIDRKANENKLFLQFELASILDVEGVQLPNRLVLVNRCPWIYRGEGCMYEYNENRVSSIHGSDTTLPVAAPVIANDKDELIQDILGSTIQIVYRGQWDKNTLYQAGHSVFIQKNNIKYHFCASVANINQQPPNSNVWIADSCSKSISACKIRYGTAGSVAGGNGIIKGLLPYGGFPSVSKVQR